MSRLASAPWPYKAAYFTLGLGLSVVVTFAIAVIIALAGLGRLTGHLDFAAVLSWFWYFREDPTVEKWSAVGLASATSLAAFITIAVFGQRRTPLHGAARWASLSELSSAGFFAKQGIVLGRRGGRVMTVGGSEHVMLYAPTRSGKGVGVVIPNLLTWAGSVVVLDVKRENWNASAGFRAAHGQNVVLFDPLDVEGRTARFNPLGHIDRTDPIAVMDELQKLAGMLFPTPLQGEPFWAEAARTGFIGLGAYVAETPDLTFSLGSIYGELTAGDPRTRLPNLVKARRSSGQALSAGCVQALSDFCSSSENTFASVRQTLTSRLNLWLNPRVRAATDASDFDLLDLSRKRMSLYLCVSPDNLDRVAPLYNLLLQQLIERHTRRLPVPGAGVEVLVLLDEFARLGQARVIAEAFSYVAGYGLRLLPVLQSPAQLRREYGADLAEEIMANCGVEIAFAPKDLRVARDLSERLGFWTYAGRSVSRPAGLSTGRRGLTESDQRRALMLPQELMQMSDRQLIVLKAGLAPVRGDKIVYWREGAFRRRVAQPPAVKPLSGAGPAAALTQPPVRPPWEVDPLSLADDLAALERLGIKPLEPGSSEADWKAWALNLVDALAKSPGSA